MHPDNIHNYSLQESFPREIVDSINRITSKWGIDYALSHLDLMQKYDAYIVRSVRVKIDHNLLAKKGTKLKEIREIYYEETINFYADAHGIDNHADSEHERSATSIPWSRRLRKVRNRRTRRRGVLRDTP